MAKKEIYNIEMPQETSDRRRSSGSRGGSRRDHEEEVRGKGKKGKKMTRSQKRRKRRKTILIIEVIVLLLLLAGLFLWLKVGLINWDDLKNLKTNNLDEETQDSVIDILRRLAEDEGKCIIIVTHSPAVAAAADQVYRLERLAPPAKKARPKPKSTLGLD